MRAKSVEKVFYEKGKLLTFEEVKAKALLFLIYIKETPEDLCDYWFGIADNWDLNIWLDVDAEGWSEVDQDKYLRATLYPLVDGNYTSEFFRIYPLTA